MPWVPGYDENATAIETGALDRGFQPSVFDGRASALPWLSS
jgi:hypothetical protein